MSLSWVDAFRIMGPAFLVSVSRASVQPPRSNPAPGAISPHRFDTPGAAPTPHGTTLHLLYIACNHVLAFPATTLQVALVDPGNWATAIEAGSRFGYELVRPSAHIRPSRVPGHNFLLPSHSSPTSTPCLSTQASAASPHAVTCRWSLQIVSRTQVWVVVASNLVAILLQTLAARLGIVTGKHLAQVCRESYPPQVRNSAGTARHGRGMWGHMAGRFGGSLRSGRGRHVQASAAAWPTVRSDTPGRDVSLLGVRTAQRERADIGVSVCVCAARPVRCRCVRCCGRCARSPLWRLTSPCCWVSGWGLAGRGRGRRAGVGWVSGWMAGCLPAYAVGWVGGGLWLSRKACVQDAFQSATLCPANCVVGRHAVCVSAAACAPPGTAIGLNLLLGWPLLPCILLTGLDALLLLLLVPVSQVRQRGSKALRQRAGGQGEMRLLTCQSLW